MASSGLESLTGDVEPRNRLGKRSTRQELTLESQCSSSRQSQSSVKKESAEGGTRRQQVKVCWEQEADLVKHIINPDAKGKWAQVLLPDIAVLLYHGVAVFRTLGRWPASVRMWGLQDGRI